MVMKIINLCYDWAYLQITLSVCILQTKQKTFLTMPLTNSYAYQTKRYKFYVLNPNSDN